MPQNHQTTDTEALVGAARSGSLDALAELYRRHADPTYALAYRMMLSSDDAADVMQDLFAGLPRALRSYVERGRFASWLKQVTVRMCLMRMRSRRRRHEEPLEAVDNVVAAGPAAAGVLDRIVLERVLAALPDQFRTVFVLKELEGYTHIEIADLLGISSANSAARLSRAWKWLRKELRT